MEYIEAAPGKPGPIALSFSGGGFRAAAYTLGCLAYLETVQLGGRPFLERVHFISSASGGTITSLAYSLSQHRAQSFITFYHQLKEQLEGSGLLKHVFDILENDEEWESRPYKTRNLINAFAIAYDKFLFKEATFGELFPNKQGAVPEICANATEFSNGMQFRFQNVGVRGNQFLHFKTSTILQQLKLADILAASSCFTVGFEPIVYPADFHYTGLDKKAMEDDIEQDSRFSPEKDDNEGKAPCFNLMDGGIDDNQGVGAFMLAEGRMQTANGFGYHLYLACDVSSNYSPGYTFPEENKTAPFLRPSLRTYFLIVLAVFALSLAGILTDNLPKLASAVLGASALVLALCLLVVYKINAAFRASKKSGNTFGLTAIPFLSRFAKMRLSILLQMLSSRATSTGYLAAVAYLKKIRRISYDRLFEKITEKTTGVGVEVKHWSRLAIQNALYLLSTKNNHRRLKDLRRETYVTDAIVTVMTPSATLQKVVDVATAMDTTLWFDKNHDKEKALESLVASGAATTCYNLLRWAQRYDQQDPYWSTVVSKLSEDWNRFNDDPFWLYQEYEKQKGI